MAHGDGIYKRPDYETYWITFKNADGRRVRENTHTTDRTLAKRLRDERAGRVARGEHLDPRPDKTTYDEAKAVLLDYYARGSRNMAEARARLAHLDGFFTGLKLTEIRTATAERYTKRRTEAGAAAGTVNREVSTLITLLHVAHGRELLQAMPATKGWKLPEPPPRSGFVTDEEFARVQQHLPDELKVAAQVAFTLGWRKREVLNLRRDQFEAQAGTLRLDPGSTKNGDGRVAYLPDELHAALVAQVGRVKEMARRLGKVTSWLFPHLDGQHAGDRIADPRKSWAAACRRAGKPGLRVHDLRRSAVRIMEQAGVPRSVATKITGHRTEAVYRRYAIVSDADLCDAKSRLVSRRPAVAGNPTASSRKNGGLDGT
jgi:integrase